MQRFRNENDVELGFVYCWINSSNSKYYIGSHKGNTNDGYVGSGKIFKRAYKKRPDVFEREILYTGEYYREVEDLILKIFDVENDDKSYNLKAIGTGGCSKGIKRSEETKDKMSKAKIGMVFTDSHRANISKSLLGQSRRSQKIKDISTGIVYPNIKQCCKELNLSVKTIYNAFFRYRQNPEQPKPPSIKNLEYVTF
jgi:hypothetical protein